MPYKMLKQVISHLRKKYVCPSCGTSYAQDSIYVLSTSFNIETLSCNAVFFVVCPACTNSAFMYAEVTNKTKQIFREAIRMQTKSSGPISTNEVLDMHNFLKTWKGDVKELFEK